MLFRSLIGVTLSSEILKNLDKIESTLNGIESIDW